ncbi:hypothetical protein L6E12_03790 [Actinokineospora sp. PR83]|uniref:hypothetical protein n=1 Tax=Actinokineospora sp. PR83 TaxID=2884908 RepID=UPI001F17D4DC|nr:hypothetical protein [Actinokineospora sp. PR83]MCG8914911.1 hypothetical protein [Actinokineospora sp. PR83]
MLTTAPLWLAVIVSGIAALADVVADALAGVLPYAVAALVVVGLWRLVISRYRR